MCGGLGLVGDIDKGQKPHTGHKGADGDENGLHRHCSGDMAGHKGGAHDVVLRVAALRFLSSMLLSSMAYGPTEVAAAEAWLYEKPSNSSWSVGPLRVKDMKSGYSSALSNRLRFHIGLNQQNRR